MTNSICKFLKRVNPLWRDQRGITGLETAIVLIAFVVVSSVFAFAALSTGLFSSDKAKETIQAGLAETRGTKGIRKSLRFFGHWGMLPPPWVLPSAFPWRK